MSESARILLLTNDDGVEAPGLAALRQAAEGLGRCRIVAPSGPFSGCSHQVTTHGPVVATRLSEDRFSVHGTPADCIRLALHHLVPEFAWVLSGINEGGNMGTDIHHSGTVAAVREAVIHGRPGIAVSQFIARGRALDWACSARWTRGVLPELLARPWEPGSFWNVNLPHAEPGAPDPSIVFCSLDPSPLPLAYCVEGDVSYYCGDYQKRAHRSSSDVDVCFGGQIAVSLVRMMPSAEIET